MKKTFISRGLQSSKYGNCLMFRIVYDV